MNYYYQRNKFVDFKSNILFHELLDTSDSEFEDWAKTLRKEVTEQWDEFGNPPVIGKNHNQIISSFEQKQKWPILQKIRKNVQDDGLNFEIEKYEQELKGLKQKKNQF